MGENSPQESSLGGHLDDTRNLANGEDRPVEASGGVLCGIRALTARRTHMGRSKKSIYRLNFPAVLYQDRLSPMATKDMIEASLAKQGCKACDRERYKVSIWVREGVNRPRKDLDNYCKSVMDGITRAGILWHDDDQVDEIAAYRIRVAGIVLTSVDVVVERLRAPDPLHERLTDASW
jgi:Holliday junction resolvase RusA-like endonuclease